MLDLLAIDGGGTRCRVACRVSGRLSVVETGSANVTSDFEGALAEITDGLQDLARISNIPLDALRRMPAYVGLAGVTGPDKAEQVRRALPLHRVAVGDDRGPALRGALGAGDGGVLHSGTGSFLGLQRDGAMAFAGGWGPVLGDEGSAQWIGRAALSAVLRVSDGVERDSALLGALRSRIGGSADVVAFAARATPAEFGALAPLVTAAGEVGDTQATSILRSGAAILSGQLRVLGWQSAMPIVLTGGLAPHYHAYLPADMQDAVTPSKGSPIDGALDLARELATKQSEVRS